MRRMGLASMWLAALCPMFQAYGELRKDIEFVRRDGTALKLDAWIPDEGTGPFPAVIIVHGGGWEAGDKNTFVPPLFEPLQQGRFAWFSIDYRLAPRHRHPAALDDVYAAIRWLKKHAATYKVDPRKIALMGESAGGHLVALAAAKPARGTRVQAVVCFYGVTDIESRSRKMGEPGKNIRQYLGVDGLDAADVAKMREASAINYVSRRTPPFLFIHGTRDAAVPYEQSPMMCEKMKAQGASCEVFTVTDAPHGIGAWEKNPAFQGYKERMVEWLKQTLR